MENGEVPQRRNPAEGVHFHLGQATILLLTITTKNRERWLANEKAHQLLRQVWFSANAWLVGDYMLMPDHIHLFCATRQIDLPIEAWISYWKRLFRMTHGQEEWKFQSRGWHHRLRNGELHSEKWKYMQENPVRKGFVQNAEDWPFKGRVFDLLWVGD